MRPEVIAMQSWDDMVFENRHQEYGAYSIRQAYSRHISVAIMIVITLTLLAIFLPRVFPPSPLHVTQPKTAKNTSSIFFIETIPAR